MRAEPQRVEKVGESALKVCWEDGHESLFTWQDLRLACPCAACLPTRPSAGGGFPVRMSAPAPVRPMDIRPVGRYGMSIQWSDGHSTGIFSYEYLRSICPCEGCHPEQLTEG